MADPVDVKRDVAKDEPLILCEKCGATHAKGQKCSEDHKTRFEAQAQAGQPQTPEDMTDEQREAQEAALKRDEQAGINARVQAAPADTRTQSGTTEERFR